MATIPELSFKKFVKSYIRYCNAHYDISGADGCESCPLAGRHDGYPTACNAWVFDEPSIAHDVVAEWVEKNPATRTPTWREWLTDPRSMSEEAMDLPIPAHLLPVLNIAPIIVEEE